MRKYQNSMERKADVPPMFLPLFQTLAPSPNIIYWNIKAYSTLTSVSNKLTEAVTNLSSENGSKFVGEGKNRKAGKPDDSDI